MAILLIIAIIAIKKNKPQMNGAQMPIKKKRHFWSLAAAIRSTIHGSNCSVEEIANKIERSPNLLYKYAMPGSAGVALPAALIAPLCKATKNPIIIKTIARECGFLLIREPRGTMSKGDKIDLAAGLQAASAQVVAAIVRENPLAPTVAQIQKLIERLVGAKRLLLSDIGQIELFSEE
jgi:hypothetical protein